MYIYIQIILDLFGNLHLVTHDLKKTSLGAFIIEYHLLFSRVLFREVFRPPFHSQIADSKQAHPPLIQIR